MAKEAGKPKVKKRGAKAGKSQGRPKFCPNSTKSFNLSTTRSNSRLHASTTALKKNNEELAKNLDLAKEVIAELLVILLQSCCGCMKSAIGSCRR